MKTKPKDLTMLTAMIPPALIEQLDIKARREMISRSAVLRQILNNHFIEEQEKWKSKNLKA